MAKRKWTLDRAFAPGAARAALALALAAALAAAAGPGRARAGEIINAIHVRVNGQPVVHQDVQDTANLLVQLRYGGHAPASRQELVELEADAVREQVRACLILEEQRKRSIRVEKAEYEERLRAYQLDPARVSPAVRRWVEAQCVLPAVLRANGIPPYQPPPQNIKDYYRRYQDTEFRQMGKVRLRRMLLVGNPGETPEDLYARAEGDRRRLEALPAPGRLQAVVDYIQANSQDIYAREGGLVSVDPDMEPGWLRETLDYYAADTQEPLFPGHVMAALRALVQSRAEGRFARPAATEFGCLMVYLEAVVPGRMASFDEAKRYIEMKLMDEGQYRKGIRWLRRKFEQSRISWNNGEPYVLEEFMPEEARTGGR